MAATSHMTSGIFHLVLLESILVTKNFNHDSPARLMRPAKPLHVRAIDRFYLTLNKFVRCIRKLIINQSYTHIKSDRNIILEWPIKLNLLKLSKLNDITRFF